MNKWKILEQKELYKTKFSKFRVDKCELPDGRIMPNYYVMEFFDWVNVVPVTDEGEIVLIKQYRHAAQEITLEVPGGSLDPEDKDPLGAASRELEEETGYVARELIQIAKYSPNPAFQSNKLHTFLAVGCNKSKVQNLDPYEDIDVETIPIDKVIGMIESGKITHALIIASIFHSLRHPEMKKFLK